TAEDAHGQTGPAGPVHLAPAEGIEDRGTRVLLRPHRRQAARAEAPSADVELALAQPGRRLAVVHAAIPDESVLHHGARRAVARVGAREHAEPERIHAEPGVLEQALEERAAHVVTPRGAAGRDRSPGAGAVAAVGECALIATLEVTLLVRCADHA